MSDTRSPHLVIGLGLLSAALIICALITAQALDHMRTASNSIAVVGSARKSIRSDFATWNTSITSQRERVQDAYQDLKHYMERIKAFLKEKQVPDSALTFEAVSTSTVPERDKEGNDTGRIQAYRITQRFSAHSADVNLITRVSREANELINEGIILESSSPEYIYTKLSELRVEMLAAAAKDAQARAATITKSAGSHIGPVRSVQTGVFQITRPNSTEVSGDGMYDTSSIDKDITAVLTMSFGVD